MAHIGPNGHFLVMITHAPLFVEDGGFILRGTGGRDIPLPENIKYTLANGPDIEGRGGGRPPIDLITYALQTYLDQ